MISAREMPWSVSSFTSVAKMSSSFRLPPPITDPVLLRSDMRRSAWLTASRSPRRKSGDFSFWSISEKPLACKRAWAVSRHNCAELRRIAPNCAELRARRTSVVNSPSISVRPPCPYLAIASRVCCQSPEISLIASSAFFSSRPSSRPDWSASTCRGRSGVRGARRWRDWHGGHHSNA